MSSVDFNIFEVVRENIDLVGYLESRGANLKAGSGTVIASTSCVLPNHSSDNTPSLKVYAGGNCHCFGCGGGGDVTRLHQSIDGFPDPLSAARDLVTREFSHMFTVEQVAMAEAIGTHGAGNIRLTSVQVQEQTDIKEFLDRLATAYTSNLTYGLTPTRDDRSPGAREAMEALSERGLAKYSLVKVFRLGYADSTGNIRIKTTAQQKSGAPCVEVSASIANKSGSLSQLGYPLIRNRLVIPVRNEVGEVVAFNGRILKSEDDRLAAKGESPRKYINSATTGVYKKGDVLYGLYENKEHIRSSNVVNVVEGCFDVQSMYRAGTWREEDPITKIKTDCKMPEVANCVASLGSAFNTNQLEMLYRSGATKRINFIFDGDKAGKEAALKNLLAIAPAIRDNIPLHVVTLPEGHDPDSYVRSFPEIKDARNNIAQLISSAPHCTDYLLQLLQEKYPDVATHAQHRIGFRIDAYEFINKLSGFGSNYRTAEQTKADFTQRVETYLGLHRSLGDLALPAVAQTKELTLALESKLSEIPDVSARFGMLEAEIARISALQERLEALKEITIKAQQTIGNPLSQKEQALRAGILLNDADEVGPPMDAKPEPVAAPGNMRKAM